MKQFDITSLTVDEADIIEELSGLEMGDVVQNLMQGRFSAKTVRGIALVLARRDDPDVKPEDVGDAVVVDALNRFKGADDSE